MSKNQSITEFMNELIDALNDNLSEDHPADCLCGIPFENGESAPMPLTEELMKSLRDTDKVKFIHTGDWVEWGKSKNYAAKTYFAVIIKEREPEPETNKREYYFFDENNIKLMYLGSYERYEDAAADAYNRYPQFDGYVITDAHIKSMYDLLGKL